MPLAIADLLPPSLRGQDVDSLSGEQFEDLLAALYRAQGWDVDKTARYDLGADLILSGSGRRIAVQAKRHGSMVGIRAVQAVVAARPHYGCVEAWVVTNSHYMPDAEKLAYSNQVMLWSRPELHGALSSSGFLDPLAATPTLACGACGAPMVSRTSSYGRFFGCSRYPRCRFKLPGSAMLPLRLDGTREKAHAESWQAAPSLPPVLSPDGLWWWDGSAWQPGATTPLPVGCLTADHRFRWDGTEWRAGTTTAVKRDQTSKYTPVAKPARRQLKRGPKQSSLGGRLIALVFLLVLYLVITNLGSTKTHAPPPTSATPPSAAGR